MNADLEVFLLRLKTQRRYSPYTARNYSKAVEQWLEYLRENQIGSAADATRRNAKQYVASLAETLEGATLRNKVSALRSFYKFLMQTNSAESDPFSGVKLPKAKKDLPVFLSEAQTPMLLQAPWDEAERGHENRMQALRDALCLELLYGAGLRVSELCGLKWRDIDFARNAATVTGKGNKTRFCPFGESAGALLKKWRAEFALSAEAGAFILHTPQKKPMYPRFVQRALAKYLAASTRPIRILLTMRILPPMRFPSSTRRPS